MIREVLRVSQFDEDRHSEATLRQAGLGMVATAALHDVIAPGVQTEVSINHGIACLDLTGEVKIDDQHYVAAGRVMQQAGYQAGLAPGHIGLWVPPGEEKTRVFASRPAIEAISAMNTGYLGYLHLVEIEYTEDNRSVGFSQRASRRDRLDVVGIVGVRTDDLDTMLRPYSLDTLTDPIDNPVLGSWFQEVGLRMNDVRPAV